MLILEENLKFNAKIKYYPNGTQKITLFSKPIFNPNKIKELSDLKSEESRRFSSALKKDKDDECERVRCDNLKRAKDKIFDISYANLNLWTHMVTFTLDKEKIDRYDVHEIKRKIKTWLNNQTKRKQCNYLIIPERHKDGAIHFHGLLSGDFTFLDSGKKDKQGRVVYNLTDFPYGFTTAVKLDENTELYVCKYITKYITKNTEKILGNFYYAGGKLLKRDLPCEYVNLDFQSNFDDCVECFVPNVDMKVKYITLGLL